MHKTSSFAPRARHIWAATKARVPMALLPALLATLPLPAGATTVRARPLSELVSDAALIVVGRTVSRESYWEGGRILTRSRITIEEVLKPLAGGETPATTIDVVSLGGVVGKFGQRVDGAEQLREGERIVLLLARDGVGAWRTVSLARSAFHVGPGVGLDDPPVWRSLEGMDLQRGATTFDERAKEPTKLSELKRIIREAIHGQ